MIIVYELAAVGAAAIAAFSIWRNVQVQKRIRAIDTRLAKMQNEIDVLKVQESRRVMLALKGNSNTESPRLNSDDGDADGIEGGVVQMLGKPRATSLP